MIHLHRLRFRLVAAVFAVAASNGAALGAQIANLSGNYLAGRSADVAKDVTAAARFYGNALSGDPDNPALIERVTTLSLATGDLERGFATAEKLVTIDKGSPVGRVSMAVRAVKQRNYAAAVEMVGQVAKAPLATLTGGLIAAWAEFGQGKTDEALARLKALSGPSWYGIFKDYHSALILDAAGRGEEAVAAISKAYKSDGSALRVVEGYARITARAGKRDEAAKAIVTLAGDIPLDPSVKQLLDTIKSGKPVAAVAASPETGAGEALYGLGSAIGPDEGLELPSAYLRLALYLDPTNHLADMVMGDILQGAQRYEEAIELYKKVPQDHPLRRNADIQIGNALDAMEKPAEAVEYLKRVVDAYPKDVEAAIQLGNVYRGNEQFALAADAYSRGIAAMGDESKADWRIFYYRGVALERSKRWAEAEADFNRALKINPDQPQVLNYLGYSWVDMGMNLDKALAMIKSAVDLRPNDGYIVDSLGWAYYRLNRYPEAVETLERAIELRPEDATINDHLGDAYWQAGRKREALFQWTHARDLDPEKDALPRILAKLQHGLKAGEPAPVAPEAQVAGLTAVPAVAPPSSIVVAKGESLWSISTRIYGTADMYLRIFEMNRDRIRDPDLIFPGTTLSLPPAPGK